MALKISIVGIGRVGSTLAYTLFIKGLCDELILVNRRMAIAEGDARDLQHALSFTELQMRIIAGGVAETAGSDIIIVCASTPAPDGVISRSELAPANVRLFSEIIPPLAEANPEAKFVIVSNPVDTLTYHTLRLTGFPPERVLGTGTLIDSARFRSMLSEELGIHPDDLRAYILGEHGATQFPVFSQAQAGGESIEDNTKRRRMFEQAVQAGFDVFHAKGYTNYAVAMATAMIIESMVHDTRHTMPLSTLLNDYHGVSRVCLSVPVVVGSTGITRILKPQLNDEEITAFRNSAKTVRSVIDEVLGADY